MAYPFCLILQKVPLEHFLNTLCIHMGAPCQDRSARDLKSAEAFANCKILWYKKKIQNHNHFNKLKHQKSAVDTTPVFSDKKATWNL